MPHFFCKLIPPRPTFPFDMNESEKALMGRHAAYWADMSRDGKVLVYGPVLEPDAPFGLGVFEAADAAEVGRWLDLDPVMQAKIGFRTQVTPMRAYTREKAPV
jgi:uncharacterized protein YciI